METMKTEVMHFTDAPEIQHFATVKVYKNDNVYGVTWGNLVREYLKTAYSEEDKKADVMSDGVTYKILKRSKVTVFYDENENTLFDVENKRLEKEYRYVMQEDNLTAKSEAETDNTDSSEAGEADKATEEFREEKSEEKHGNDVSTGDIAPFDPESIKQIAKEKLEKEMNSGEDKTFAEPVIGYLLQRCEDDLGLAQDVIQEHKTWKKCLDYIFGQARKQATGNRAAVRGDVVYEWAEDYYRKDDKAEEEKKIKEAVERKKKAVEQKKADKKNPKQTAKKEGNAEEKPAEPTKPKKNPQEMDGQMDLFSMMGM